MILSFIGDVKGHLANFIAENTQSQADEDGHNIQIMDSIVYCREDSNVFDKTDVLLITKSEQ